jgi:hypothetical protein
MITGFGVAEAVRHFYSIWWRCKGKKDCSRLGVQQQLLFTNGEYVIGIIDRDGGLINEGFTFEEIRSLFLTRMVINGCRKHDSF